jgi:hypothetical protein
VKVSESDKRELGREREAREGEREREGAVN